MQFRTRTVFTCVFLALLRITITGTADDTGTETDLAEQAAASAPQSFVHPGILHNVAELQFVREKVAAGEQPWKTAWEALTSDRMASLDWKPRAHKHVERGPYNNPSIGANEMMSDSAAAYTHALHWWISGEKAHASKSIEILDNYSVTLQSVGHHDARLLVGMAGIHFVGAAELIKHSSTGWSESQQQRFEKMLRDVLSPVIKNFYPSANGNWDAAMIQTMMAMGVYLDDHQLFQRAVDYYLGGAGNGCITRYFKPSGQCQESGRDQSHTQMGLGYLGCAAEIAWKQGADLYGAANNRLAAGFEYTAKYNLGHEVPYERYISFAGRYDYKQISDRGRGRFAPIYEIVYRHYHDRKGMPMEFTSQVIAKNRPERPSTTHTPWASLMFTKNAAR